MNKSHWKLRLFTWYANHILKVPFIVNFTPPDMTNMYAIGFAWTPGARDRMMGNEMLINRLKNAEALAQALSTTRSGRRQTNKIVKSANDNKRSNPSSVFSNIRDNDK